MVINITEVTTYKHTVTSFACARTYGWVTSFGRVVVIYDPYYTG